MKQYSVRKTSFDSAHRVMDEAMKCYNIHGHTYHVKLVFSYISIANIGYALDFKEIKRVGVQWIDDILDHGVILNPKDDKLIGTALVLESKLWLMSLNGIDYCNPSAENIGKEIFLAMEILFKNHATEHDFKIHKVILKETPNCSVITKKYSISDKERTLFNKHKGSYIEDYAKEKGIVEYDSRKK